MTYITVKKLADELEISKQAIHKRIKQLPPALKPELIKGAYRLSDQTANFIRDSVQPTTSDNQPDNIESHTKQSNGVSTKNITYQPTTDNQFIVEESFTDDYIKSVIEEVVVKTFNSNELTTLHQVNEKSTTDNQPANEKVDALKEIIEDLKKDKSKLYNQLTEQNERLKEANKNLDQQQQLALKMKLQNNKLKLQVEEYEDVKETSAKRKWWQFFK